MNNAKVRGRLVRDRTGNHYYMPMVVTNEGPVMVLVDFFLEYQYRSLSWKNLVVQAVRLLIEYLEMNQDCFRKPKELFSGFASALYNGTVGYDGLDPSGLYWPARSRNTAGRLVSVLTVFTDYLAHEHGKVDMNPLRPADSHERRMIYAAWQRKRKDDFLAHIKSRDMIKYDTHSFQNKSSLVVDDSAVAFPDADFECFYRALSYDRWKRAITLRDRLIVLLLHGGGLRTCEPFHLFVQDVGEKDTPDGRTAVVRVYHPEEGLAPDGWKGPKRERNRTAYLRSVYGLMPRNLIDGSQHAGWKGRKVDSPENYMQVPWFYLHFGREFLDLWEEYMTHRAQVGKNHPYAFVSFVGDNYGKPLNISSFIKSYNRALNRAGLKPGRANAHSPHCHRHSYGRRLVAAGFDPHEIMKAMHHTTPDSQAVYTTPGAEEIYNRFRDAEMRINEQAKALPE